MARYGPFLRGGFVAQVLMRLVRGLTGEGVLLSVARDVLEQTEPRYVIKVRR